MADIIQAAKWMQEGNKVCRKSWPSDAKRNQRPWWAPWRNGHSPFAVIAGKGWDDITVPDISLDSLLAGDWEIAND